MLSDSDLYRFKSMCFQTFKLHVPLSYQHCVVPSPTLQAGSLVWGFAQVSWQPSHNLREGGAGENGCSQIAAPLPRYSQKTQNKCACSQATLRQKGGSLKPNFFKAKLEFPVGGHWVGYPNSKFVLPQSVDEAPSMQLFALLICCKY